MATKLDHALIDEYGLNPTTFRLLKLASKSDIEWNGPGLKAITTQPAPGLRKLVERGLLDGPGRTEKVNCRPFSLTDAGRDVLAKIERGLHKNSWMSEARVKALETIMDHKLTGGPRLFHFRQAKVQPATLQSLKENGYIYNQDLDWYLTDLGREALAAWRADACTRSVAVSGNVAVEVSSGY